MNPSLLSTASGSTTSDCSTVHRDRTQRRREAQPPADLMALFDQLDARIRLPFVAIGRNEDVRQIRCFITRARRVDVLQSQDDLAFEADPQQRLLHDGPFDSGTLARHLDLQHSPDGFFDLALNLCGYLRPDPLHHPLQVTFGLDGPAHQLTVHAEKASEVPGAYPSAGTIRSALPGGAHVSVTGASGRPVIILTARDTGRSAESTTDASPWLRHDWLTVLPPLIPIH